MLATNPPVIKLSNRLSIQAVSGDSGLIIIEKKIYNGQLRQLHLTIDEIKEIAARV